MNVRRIENDETYRDALRTVSMLVDLDPAPGSPDGARLAALVRWVEQYEETFMRKLRQATQ
jgi:HTH-type transcriptional regulator / antitoxin HigA